MVFNPYASAKQFFSATGAPGYVVTDEDKERIQSYELYEKIYWNQPETFKVQQRGSDSSPIYLPSARKIIEACNRFLGVNFNYIVSGDSGDMITNLLASLFKREQFFTKYATQKRYGLIRGDAIWHLVGDDTKPESQRLSMYELEPSSYFPIMDGEKRIGCHLVDIIIDPNDPNGTKLVARRQTYRKEQDGSISSELAYFEPAAWDDRNLKPKDIKLVRTVKPKFSLPAPINALPVYVIPNNRIPGPRPFGYSELIGIERVLAAVDQAVSDEELALAFAGLGVFWTTAGPPKNESGQIVAWDIGPARMIEVGKDSVVNRLQGVTSVDPSIDHMNFILDETQSGIGIPDIAAGKVDVDIAESGISLQLQLAPLLAKNAEKEGTLIERYDQMFYDIVHGWLPAYEGTPADTTAIVESVTGDPMPKNRQTEIQEITDLVAAGLLSAEEARVILKNKFGYEINPGVEGLLKEKAARAAAEDPFAARSGEELNGESGDSGQQNANNNGVVLPA